MRRGNWRNSRNGLIFITQETGTSMVFGFTLIEMLVVITIIGILAGILIPALKGAREKAKYARWLGYSNGLRCDSRLVGYWNFEEPKPEGSILRNKAAGPQDDARYDIAKVDGNIEGCEWDDGRWRSKGALRFNGNACVTVPDNDLWTFSEDFTLEVWVNADSWAGDWWARSFLAQDEGGSDQNKWIFSYDSGTNQTIFHINGPAYGGGVKIYGSTWTAKTGVWYHIAVARSVNTYTFYKDGESNGSATGTLSITNSPAPLRMGWAEGSQRFEGFIDEVAVYNQALSPSEIKGHYEMGKP